MHLPGQLSFISVGPARPDKTHLQVQVPPDQSVPLTPRTTPPSLLPTTCGSVHWTHDFQRRGCAPQTVGQFLRTQNRPRHGEEAETGRKRSHCSEKLVSDTRASLSPGPQAPCAPLETSQGLPVHHPAACPRPRAPLLRLPSSCSQSSGPRHPHWPWPFPRIREPALTGPQNCPLPEQTNVLSNKKQQNKTNDNKKPLLLLPPSQVQELFRAH